MPRNFVSSNLYVPSISYNKVTPNADVHRETGEKFPSNGLHDNSMLHDNLINNSMLHDNLINELLFIDNKNKNCATDVDKNKNCITVINKNKNCATDVDNNKNCVNDTNNTVLRDTSHSKDDIPCNTDVNLVDVRPVIAVKINGKCIEYVAHMFYSQDH